MSTFAIWMLKLLCSTCCICEIRGAVIKSSVTSIGTRLVLQSLTDHDGKDCHQTCAEIGSSCNFAKIHLISVPEMRNLILDMLPNKNCFQAGSTLVDNWYKKHNEVYDPVFNVENSCTQGFEQIGYTKPYPACETEGTYQFARICQCGNNNVSDSMTSIGTWLIAQDFRTSGQKDCTKTCAEAGMMCDFDNFGSIALQEWKLMIGNILPREVCHSYYADSPSVLESDEWKNYNNAMDPRFNKWNNCVSGYLSNGGTNELQCNWNGSDQFARICQCKKATSNTNCLPQGQKVRYGGVKRKTLSGKPCVWWGDTEFSGSNLVRGNFCRNPNNRTYPWCFTDTDGNWEYCFDHECYGEVINGARCTSDGKCIRSTATCTKLVSGSYCFDVCNSDVDCAGPSRCTGGKCICATFTKSCSVDEDCCSGKCSSKKCAMWDMYSGSGCSIDSECDQFKESIYNLQNGFCHPSEYKCTN